MGVSFDIFKGISQNMGLVQCIQDTVELELLAKVSNGVLICFKDQGKTWVAKHYKLNALFKEIVYKIKVSEIMVR